MPQSLSLCAALAVVVGIGGCMPPPPAPSGEDILFDSERNSSGTGDQSIYRMAPDGSNVRQLAHVQGVTSFLPDWSPDRKRIAFSSNRTGPWDDLYVMDADGGNVRQLTDTPEVSEHNAAWSPDGRHIAYSAQARSPIAADGTRQDRQPAQIWIMDADGSNARALTTGSSRNMSPAWSPDGSTIAFASDRHADFDPNFVGTDEGDLDIYLMDPNGSNVRRLTETEGAATANNPAWSPDGQWIAFQTYRDGDWDIYVMKADGTNSRRLGPRGAARAAWSPDGKEIAFTSWRKLQPEKSEICVIRADGSGFRTVTQNQVFDGHPDWW